MKASKGEKEFALLRALMRPALRYCLRRSLKIQDAYSALKEEFLDLANHELSQSGETVSVSKLSASTGLQRKDIRKIVGREEEEESKRELNLIVRISSSWSFSRAYSAKGKPKKLTFKGKDSEFALLVREINSDLSHHTILNEMERLGLVKRSGENVSLVRHGVNLKGLDGLFSTSTDIDQLFLSASENIESEKEIENLHARTSFDNIPESALPKINEWILDLGSQIHKKVHGYLAKFDRDTNPQVKHPGKAHRVSFTTFSFKEQSPTRGNKSDE